ncbi:unnamed protein product [Tilletia controversa]|uniref:Ran guanine nucleotide release factor n=1 Tax=Tilletia controversa TaxID=13291 RepID=A0A8X7MV56_9BASI|nr:hypothetical protein CF328_g1893 [Tilletia controversa]KAE8249707.1 hypothetical protein A4X06_0g3103 [Tilletia controversa]CAD6906010.1 unnamed protein product [Tilletia controversa]CAD6975187.1 unnamed protein product [Tilletia controversa]
MPSVVAGSSSSRPLFGGSIVADLPASWKDVSDFRQVPDNQEVFVSPDTDPNGEASLIVEVLQKVDQTELEAAVRFHFDSIAHDNDAEESHVVRTWSLDGKPQPMMLSGTQMVKKFGKDSEASKRVEIWVALWRIEGKNVDLVMSVNASGSGSEAGDGEGQSGREGEVARIFERAASSLSIVDHGLFA